MKCCSHCGKELEPSMTVCPFCGTEIKNGVEDSLVEGTAGQYSPYCGKRLSGAKNRKNLYYLYLF